MKALLICPAKRASVASLAEAAPLAALAILGKPLIEYWLDHYATLGAREITILAGDRPDEILTLVGDGARWGLHVSLHPVIRELAPAEARARFRAADYSNWLPAPHDVALMDRLPQQPEFPLFTSYAAWFAAVMNWLPRAATNPFRIGVREIKPGVWVGLHTRVAADAELHAPCWLGENVFVGGGAVIGPMAAVEDMSFIEPGAKISESVVGPETFVGEFTEIRHSIAWGSTLVNWQLDSCLKVPDAFLLRPLKLRTSPVGSLFQASPAVERQIDWSWKFNAKTEP